MLVGCEERTSHCSRLEWVDDLVYGSTDETFTGSVETEVGKNFPVGDCGDLTWFLGTSFEMSADRHSLSPSMYISNLLKKFGMRTASPFQQLWLRG